MMTILQIFSHNALVAENVEGQRMVLVGRGIGFNRQKGERIDRNVATKIYVESK